MTLFIQSAMIFFGTLLALGEPHAARSAQVQDSVDRGVLLVLEGSWPDSTVAPSRR